MSMYFNIINVCLVLHAMYVYIMKYHKCQPISWNVSPFHDMSAYIIKISWIVVHIMKGLSISWKMSIYLEMNVYSIERLSISWYVCLQKSVDISWNILIYIYISDIFSVLRCLSFSLNIFLIVVKYITLTLYN